MKSDTSDSLCNSHFAKYLSFTRKNDPFLVYPSLKHAGEVIQGTSMQGIKRLRAASNGQSMPKMKKLTLPLQTSLMKVIRQCEVYLMEEAVTDQIIKTTTTIIGTLESRIKTPEGVDTIEGSKENATPQPET